MQEQIQANFNSIKNYLGGLFSQAGNSIPQGFQHLFQNLPQPPYVPPAFGTPPLKAPTPQGIVPLWSGAVGLNKQPDQSYAQAYAQDMKDAIHAQANAFNPSAPQEVRKQGQEALVNMAGTFFGGMRNVAKEGSQLTTKFLDYAKGKTTLSRQEIMDFARRPELKRGEADLLNRLGNEVKDGKIPAQEFTDSIRRDLLELKPVKVHNPQYTGTTIDKTRQLGSEMYGKNAKGGFNYEEVVFESPITTNGSSHYPNSKNYFAHARGDEVVESGKKIWREQEIQSDALQKEGLERMKPNYYNVDDYLPANKKSELNKIKSRTGDIRGAANKNVYKDELADLKKREEQLLNEAEVFKTNKLAESEKEVEKLSPFTNDRFGERIMRERIKAKAQAGYEKYRLPTGETIGKIEGFQENQWFNTSKRHVVNSRGVETGEVTHAAENRLKPEDLEVGKAVKNNFGKDWIITDILGDGRFKAVPKHFVEKGTGEKMNQTQLINASETFDLTGKSNPQYRRYSDWGKFLKNKFGGKEVTDPQGNSWMEIDLKKEMSKLPIEAFGIIPFANMLSQPDNKQK